MPIVVASAVPQVPATDSTSPDGLLRAEVISATAGVRLTVDYTSLLSDVTLHWPNPFRATVYRVNPDGSTVVVRSADDREQGGGKFIAYDDEVSFGTIYPYYAEAPLQDGTLGRRSFGVSVLTWAPAGGDSVPGVWIKSLDRPTLSAPVRTNDWTAWTYANRSSATDILGSKYSAVNMRPRAAGTTNLQVLTKTGDEYTNLLELASSGVVFIASLNRSWQRDGYYLIEDVAPSRPTNSSGQDFDYWSISARLVARPGTANQNYPVVPWKTLDEVKAGYATLDDVKAAYSTFNALTRAM